jgi:glycosyltransferase involved in cell wall biosynthesis
MLAILTTHPIQYQVPLWQELASDGRVPFEVWYLTDHGVRPSADREFGQTFSWDIETLKGYPHRFLTAPADSTPASFLKCRLAERLRKRLRRSGAQALWIQGWQVAGYWQGIREANAAGIEVWLRGESNDLAPWPRWKRPLKRAQLSWLFRRVDRFFYIGAANRRLYEKFGVEERRMYPAPYAVDNRRFAEQAAALRPQRAELRRKWGIPEDAFCVLFCGKLIEKKRPMDLVGAAQILLTNGSMPNVHLLFAGSGPMGSRLRHACRVAFDAESKPPSPTAEQLVPPASFTGFLNQTEVSKAYTAADCLVLPSDHRETWGLVVNEALASGLPCLISDACGCAEDLAGGFGTFSSSKISDLALKLSIVANTAGKVVVLPTFSASVASIAQAFQEMLESSGRKSNGMPSIKWLASRRTQGSSDLQ